MTTPLVWSERVEPAGGGLKDCAYSAGLTALVFGGFTKFPLGIWTVAEREALERSDDQPDETGASLADLVVAVKRRYGIDWTESRIALLAQHKARTDLAFVITGMNGNLPAGHTLRRWQPGYALGHAATIRPVGDGIKVRFLDPLAPNKYPGDITDWPTVMRWMGGSPEFISVRENEYAPPPPVVVTPTTYTKAQLDAAITKAEAAAHNAVLDKALAAVNAAQAAISAIPRR